MATDYGNNDWMSQLEGNTPLNKINLIGTYNSDATNGASVLEQLNRGFRFFHLILTSDGSFKNAINSISSFLSSHQAEVVIVQINRLLGGKVAAEDSRGQDFLTIFQNTFQGGQPDIRSSVHYTNNEPSYSIPLDHVRGKMILLADNDLQLGYAFDSPLTVDPNTFWPLNMRTQITDIPSGDPETWGSAFGANAPWDKVNSALVLALARDQLKKIGTTDTFANESFFQLWLASEQTAGNAAVATYFYKGIGQVLTHGTDRRSGEKGGLPLGLGLIVVDNINFDQDIIEHVIQANPAMKP